MQSQTLKVILHILRRSDDNDYSTEGDSHNAA